MGRVMNGFCDGCDCLDSNSWGLFCQILGGGCIREGHPDNVKEGNTLSEDNKGLEKYKEIERIIYILKFDKTVKEYHRLKHIRL